MNNKYMVEVDEYDKYDLMSMRNVIYNVQVYNDKNKYRMIVKDNDKTISMDITNIVKDLKKER